MVKGQCNGGKIIGILFAAAIVGEVEGVKVSGEEVSGSCAQSITDGGRFSGNKGGERRLSARKGKKGAICRLMVMTETSKTVLLRIKGGEGSKSLDRASSGLVMSSLGTNATGIGGKGRMSTEHVQAGGKSIQSMFRSSHILRVLGEGQGLFRVHGPGA